MMSTQPTKILEKIQPCQKVVSFWSWLRGGELISMDWVRLGGLIGRNRFSGLGTGLMKSSERTGNSRYERIRGKGAMQDQFKKRVRSCKCFANKRTRKGGRDAGTT